jgi:class 3 adenylate cyclase
VVERRDSDYFGSPVNRAARIMSVAHGGQVLLSQAVADCVRDLLPAAISLRDLGKVRLKDLSTPEHVYQVVHPQLRQEFPALRSLEATPNNLPQQVTRFIGR